MRYGRLKKYTLKTMPYKNGEYFTRVNLEFDIYFFKFKIKTKNITYDLTMFDSVRLYTENWDNMIKNKSKIQFKVIKDNIIF